MIRRNLSRASTVWAARQRTSGEPRSANGASSFHLIWDLPQVPLLRVEATLEVVVPPAVPRLYFWALQVSFAAGPRLQGGAHLGLQWHPRYPGSTAVNFGGYGPAERGTRVLEGTTSELRGRRRQPNTRDFPWQLGHRYRLAVSPAPEAPEGLKAWRGTVEDLDGGGAAGGAGPVHPGGVPALAHGVVRGVRPLRAPLGGGPLERPAAPPPRRARNCARPTSG